jgi:chaperonin cofactor prefoldin
LTQIHFEVPHPLLVCTYTNVAVDNLLEGLADAGLKPLRVGYGGKVKKSLEVYTVEYQKSKHPLKPTVDSLEKDIAELQHSLKKLATSIVELDDALQSPRPPASLLNRQATMERRHSALEKRTKATQAKLFAVEDEMIRDILGRADVASFQRHDKPGKKC